MRKIPENLAFYAVTLGSMRPIRYWSKTSKARDSRGGSFGWEALLVLAEDLDRCRVLRGRRRGTDSGYCPTFQIRMRTEG